MDIEQWVQQIPKKFPDLFENKTAFQNPLIQDSQEETLKAIHDVMQFLLEAALPWPGNETLNLSEDSTWGYIHIFQCAISALAFERRYRPDGGELRKEQKVPESSSNKGPHNDSS